MILYSMFGGIPAYWERLILLSGDGECQEL